MATIRKIDGKRGSVYRAIIRKQGQNLSRTFKIQMDAIAFRSPTVSGGFAESLVTLNGRT